MPRAVPKRLARALVGAFFTLLAWNLVAPGSSLAGCVHDRPSASHFEGLIGAGAMDRPHDEILLPKKTPAGQVPTCTGPLCSRGPAAPSPAPWASAPPDDSRAITTEGLTPVESPPFDRLAPESTATLPMAPGTSIFHPPRLATI